MSLSGSTTVGRPVRRPVFAAVPADEVPEQLVAGRVQPVGQLLLGSLRIGSLWESLAVPELRQQAQALATQVVAGAATAMP